MVSIGWYFGCLKGQLWGVLVEGLCIRLIRGCLKLKARYQVYKAFGKSPRLATPVLPWSIGILGTKRDYCGLSGTVVSPIGDGLIRVPRLLFESTPEPSLKDNLRSPENQNQRPP